jgi:hypothetical protein
MAKQMGTITLKGTVGNITFFKSGDGYLVRSRGGVSAKTIATHPAFQRTRENNAEFSNAAKGGRLLRTSLRSTIVNGRDTHMVSRLTSQMLRAVQADTISSRGLRNITGGDAGLLQGFNFNNSASLSATLSVHYTVSFSRSSGTIQLSIEDFIPFKLLTAPAGTTHFRFVAAAAAVNFEDNSYEAATATSANLVYNNIATGTLTLRMALSPNSTDPVFIVLGIEFLQQANGDQYTLHNRAANACSIIKVDTPA